MYPVFCEATLEVAQRSSLGRHAAIQPYGTGEIGSGALPVRRMAHVSQRATLFHAALLVLPAYVNAFLLSFLRVQWLRFTAFASVFANAADSTPHAKR